MKFKYAFPPMDEFEIANGLKIICMPDHEQCGCVVALQLPVGRFSDPPGREGLCEITCGLLSKGSAGYTADEFAEKLENAGATLFSEVGEEYCVLGIRMLASSAPSLLPLFVEMIHRPRFAKEEFARLKQEMITGLQAETADTALIALRHFYSALAGKEHPAGRFQCVPSLKTITIAEVKGFFGDYFSPVNALCVAAGDYDREPLRQFVAAQFSQWVHAFGETAVIAPPLPHRTGRAIVRIINKPDVTQTSLAIGHASPGEKCPEKNALLLANHIFGGGNFSSRLMARIRSAGGKTYGIASQLLSEKDFGAFMISTATQNSQLGDVLTSIFEEYRRFCRDGVTAEELEKARRFAIGNMAFQLEGIGAVVDKLLWLRFYGRPKSYIERFEEIISSIDVGAVNSAIRMHMLPENLVIAAVGKRTEIQDQLKPFGDIKNYHFRDKV
jgi:zinc protease